MPKGHQVQCIEYLLKAIDREDDLIKSLRQIKKALWI